MLMGTPSGETTPLRLGVAGFGRLAREYYVPALKSLGAVRVTAVADPLEASRMAAERLLPGIVNYPDPMTMLEREILDALLVASPPSTHLEIWNRAARRGIPVFMEKPFVLDQELGRAESSAHARRLLMINFNRRFWPGYQRVRSLLDAGAIGDVERGEFLLHVDVASWCAVTAHRLMPSEGSVLYDLGSQVLDLVRELIPEEPVNLMAETWTRRWDADHVRLELGFAGGATVWCDLAYEDRTRESVMIGGSRGTLRLRDPNKVVHLEPGGRLLGWCRDAVVFAYRALRRDRSMSRRSIRTSLDAFATAVRAKTPFHPGFEDAVRNAIWLEAAVRSAAEKRRVHLDAGGT